MDRRAWLEERRRISMERMDGFAPTYDRDWGEISGVHRRMLGDLIGSLPAHATILDIPCGTGKYFPMLLEAGADVTGIDRSRGMLEKAREKFPDVALREGDLQDLSDQAAYDAVLCIDAMEYVSPEDWVEVARNLRRAVKAGGALYLTIELADEAEIDREYAEARDLGMPVVPGECVISGGYHYYPGRDRALGWLADAGIVVDRVEEDDVYLHVVGHRG